MNGSSVAGVLCFALLAPLAGGLLSGLERIITAFLIDNEFPEFVQLIQPFKDILGLFRSEDQPGEKNVSPYAAAYIFITVISGCAFFYGGSMMPVVLLLIAAGTAYIAGIAISQKTYKNSFVEVELLRLGLYFTQLSLTALGFYFVTGLKTGSGSFSVNAAVSLGGASAFYLPGLLVGTAAVFIFASRKSFIGKNVSEGYSGINLALFECGRWYEDIILLSFIFLLNFGGSVFSAAIALIFCILIYFLRALIMHPASSDIHPAVNHAIMLVVLILDFVNLTILL